MDIKGCIIKRIFHAHFAHADLVALHSINKTKKVTKENYLYFKALRSYIFVCMLAIAGQTAGPNGLKLF